MPPCVSLPGKLWSPLGPWPCWPFWWLFSSASWPLIGWDQYWNLATFETQPERIRPVVINKELRWFLSGPSTSPNNIQHNTSLITHTLCVDGVIQDAQALDDSLKSLWDLESFGIFPPSSTIPLIQEGLLSSVCFVGGRYQVELPWKELPSSLADTWTFAWNICKG